MRLRRADGTVFFEDSFAATVSASGLIHAVCGPWHGLSGISCGGSWVNTCQLQLLHSESVHVKVWEADLELKSNSARKTRMDKNQCWKLYRMIGW